MSGQVSRGSACEMLQFDGQKATGMYALTDSLMERNQVNKFKNIQQPMEDELKAIIQQYMERMTQDRLQP